MVEIVSIITGLSQAIGLVEKPKNSLVNLSLRKKLFNKYIEPMFEELQPVIKFYADNIAT